MPKRQRNLDPETELLGYGLVVIFALAIVWFFYQAVAGYA